MQIVIWCSNRQCEVILRTKKLRTAQFLRETIKFVMFSKNLEIIYFQVQVCMLERVVSLKDSVGNLSSVCEYSRVFLASSLMQMRRCCRIVAKVTIMNLRQNMIWAKLHYNNRIIVVVKYEVLLYYPFKMACHKVRPSIRIRSSLQQMNQSNKWTL